jgi:uncharacterized protein
VISLLFNLLVVPLDCWVLHGIVRRRSFLSVAARAVGWAAGGVAASVALGEDGFGIIRLFAWFTFLHAVFLLAASGVILVRQGRTIGSRGRQGLGVVALGGACIGASVCAWSFLIEPRMLEVTHVRLESAKIDQPVRIVVLSDFQTDAIGSYEHSVVREVASLHADLLLLPGDYIQAMDHRAHHDAWEGFVGLLKAEGVKAPLGVFAVGGDCERGSVWTRWFDGLPIVAWDETTSVDAGPVRLTGLSYDDSGDTRLRVAPADRFHVVFGHRPDFALGEISADLLIAGHTHGGQVRFPFIGPLITLSRVPRAWAAGVTRLSGGRTLAVTRGTGMERGHAPRLRFLCRPEIMVIEIRPATKSR